MDLEQLFSNYFSRFEGIYELPFVTLEPPKVSGTRNGTYSDSTGISSVARPVTDNPCQTSSTTPSLSTQQAREEWLSNYQNCLQSHISDLDGGSPNRMRESVSREVPDIETEQVDKEHSPWQVAQPPGSIRNSEINGSPPLFQNQNIQFLPNKDLWNLQNHQEADRMLASQPELSPSLLQPLSQDGPCNPNDIFPQGASNQEGIGHHSLIATGPGVCDMPGASEYSLEYDNDVQRLELGMSIDFSNFVNMGEEMFPPVPTTSYTGNLDWMWDL
jgi:hypothetical protein